MRYQYKNGVGDWFVSDKNIQLEEQKIALEQQKLGLMGQIASQPATSVNKWIIIIPIAVLLVGGIAAFILLKKKK